jgi:branched-subunit amino acid aminotransferase/4-amino-4-deoxychorismate lyase
MQIKAFEIIRTKNTPLKLEASSLDEMTSQLPAGFYTTFTTLNQGTRVVGLQSHLDRLYVPARNAKLTPVVDKDTLKKRIAGLVQEYLPAESRVRLILSKQDGSIFAGIQPFEPLPNSVYEKGVHVITVEMSRNAPQIKDSAFITSSRLERLKLADDVFEVLMTKNGVILEGLTSNFYGILQKTLCSAQEGILPGVTRGVILELAAGEGMSIDLHAPRTNEQFDEAFLTSSSRGVIPIISIDGNKVGDGNVGMWTKKLTKAYQANIQEKSEILVK